MSRVLGVEYFCRVSCCAQRPNESGFFHECKLEIGVRKGFGACKIIKNTLMIVFCFGVAFFEV